MNEKVFVEGQDLTKVWDGTGKIFDPCELYEWRLEWLEKKVAEHHYHKRVKDEAQYQKWWDEEEKVYQNNRRDSERVAKLRKNIGIIVPTHYHHSRFITACLESLSKLGYFVLLAYDNPFYSPTRKIHESMPSVKGLFLADYISIKPKTWASGVGVPHAWNMFFGIKMLKTLGFEYIFNLNGDCILEKPENFPKLIELLGDGDCITCEWIPERKYAGTMAYLIKTELADEIWSQYIQKIYWFNIGNAEARMGRFLLDSKCKVIPVDNPTEAHFKCGPNTEATDNATFRTLLGLRHLHAEHKVRRSLKMEPIEEKYFDYGPDMIFMNGHERNTMIKYFKTKDRKYLEAWWE